MLVEKIIEMFQKKVFPFLQLGPPHYQITWVFPKAKVTPRGHLATGADTAVEIPCIMEINFNVTDDKLDISLEILVILLAVIRKSNS